LANGDDTQLDRPISCSGSTQLQEAIRRRDIQVVGWLLEHGAVLNNALKDLAREVAKQNKEVESEKDDILTFINKFRKGEGGTPPRWKVELVKPASGEGKSVAKTSVAEAAMGVNTPTGRPPIQKSISKESAGKSPKPQTSPRKGMADMSTSVSKAGGGAYPATSSLRSLSSFKIWSPRGEGKSNNEVTHAAGEAREVSSKVVPSASGPRRQQHALPIEPG